MVRVNWLALKTLGVFVGGALFLFGTLTVIVALTGGEPLEVGRGDPDVYDARQQLWIGLGVAVVGALMAGIPLFLSLREIVRVGRRRLRDEPGERP